ncbi:MAG TPA: ATP-binding protein [Cyclobacteriaceae bacterium]|nr:response regulator [Cyclobacteriaceae bacterium]HMV09275.1 ATP-binding protein [Cyclobacteriaceae bacterium]HMV91004.1 ATP-binding protein [Cyclobacteriaceae bacterium]HMX01925.1 ATP-binding protein [Cyclobacteriaceae bacterium]HMX50848.1 ATP-binding protein [Cyclobacteriaceae bacterium]
MAGKHGNIVKGNKIKALKSKYLLFIISIILIIAAQVGIQYWFGQETGLSLLLSALAVLIIILEFVFIFLPSLRRLTSANRKLVRLRKSLEDSERQYRELVEGAADIIYELNSEGQFSYVNELMLKMSGYTREEMIGRFYLELIHPDDRAYAASFYRNKLKAGEETSYLEFRMIGRNGQTTWIGQNVRYFYEQSWVTHVRVVARDITEGRLAQLALKQLKEEAERTTRAKSQFLSMMSHEIRTPMNAIIGLTNLLGDTRLTPEQKHHVQLLKFSGENLLTIINDILDFSKIEAQKIALEYIDFDLRELFDKTIEIQRQRADEKSITLKYHIDPQLPQAFKGDPVRIIQIITNLVSNAIKFTHEGSVTVNLVQLATAGETVTLQIDVTDTGIGIPSDKLETIFESFSQAEEATARKYGGTGLGLAITRKLVDLMGGVISVKSTEGNGSTFTCVLTLERGEVNVQETEQPPEVLAIPAGIHVLVAEDNQVNQLMVTSFLKKWDVKYTVVENGVAALKAIQEQRFNIVLMDLQMPEMSGYEVTEKIRGMDEPYYTNIPIIALTASAMTEVRAQVLAAGMNDFLSKPFHPDDLKRIVVKYARF